MAHRILYISESVTFGGAERYLGILWERMDRRRFTPELFCHPDSPKALIESAHAQDVEIRFVDPIRGKRDIGGMIRQRRLFRDVAADLIHFNLFNAYQGQYSILAARWVGISRLVASYHLLPRSRTASLRGRLLERLLMRAMDRIIAGSESGAVILSRYFGAPIDKLTVIYNGIETERIVPGPGIVYDGLRGRKVVIAVGRLTPQKGFSLLIEAAPKVIEAVPDTVFLIVGDGPMRPDLERTASASVARKAIVFAGERWEDVHNLIKGANILVLPSVYEGFPLIVLEAMACGRPVVATAVDGVPEAVADGETGILVPPGDSGRFGEALIGLLRDPERAEEMGRRGRARVETLFSASRMVEKTQAVYESCLASR